MGSTHNQEDEESRSQASHHVRKGDRAQPNHNLSRVAAGTVEICQARPEAEAHAKRRKPYREDSSRHAPKGDPQTHPPKWQSTYSQHTVNITVNIEKHGEKHSLH